MTPIEEGLSVIIPVYNSAAILPGLVARIEPVLATLTKNFELIFINDGSKDKSWKIVKMLSGSHGWIRGICMMRNYGQHNALLSGIRSARYDTIATMDDDLQHPPEELPRLFAALGEDVDVVYGAPEKEQHGLMRNAASIIMKIALQSAMGAESARNVSAFRVFRTRLRDAFAQFNGSLVSIDVLLTWGTRNFKAIKVRHDERIEGKSNYTLIKLIRHAFNMITGFSTLPLQLASVLGFVFSFFGILVLSYVVLKFLFYGSPVAGFPFIVSIIAIFSGVQLFALGIFGEYLSRMHFRIMDRPSYAIAQTTNLPDKAEDEKPK